MTVAVWVLLAFAGWTILILSFSVGLYRWSRVLTGRSEIKDFRADDVQGHDWYKRAMRAHANCIENLPVYGAIVLVIVAARIDAPLLDNLAIVLIAARVIHSTIHIAFEQTNIVAGLRFAFFFPQLICMVAMGTYVVIAAG